MDKSHPSIYVLLRRNHPSADPGFEAFPQQCAFPHKSGTTNALSPLEFQGGWDGCWPRILSR